MTKKFLLTSATLLSVAGGFAQTVTDKVTNADQSGTATVTYDDGITFSATFAMPTSTSTTLTVDSYNYSDANAVLSITIEGSKKEVETTTYEMKATNASTLTSTAITLDGTSTAESYVDRTTGKDCIGEVGTSQYIIGMNKAIGMSSYIPGFNVLPYSETNINYNYFYYTLTSIWDEASEDSIRSTQWVKNNNKDDKESYYFKDNVNSNTGTHSNRAYNSINLDDNRTTDNYTKEIFTVTAIADGFINGNNSVKYIKLGSSITTIEAGAFRGASNLSTIDCDVNPNFMFVDGILYDKDQTIIYAASCDVKNQEIPASVAEIKEWAFANAQNKIYLTTKREGDITIGANQNDANKVSVSKIKDNLELPAKNENGGYTISDNVTKTNIKNLIKYLKDNNILATYIEFTGTVTEDLGNLSDSETYTNPYNGTALLFFNTEFAVSGTNVINKTTCNNLVITDKVDFYNPKEFTAEKVSYSRSFANGIWNTICLPFAVTEGTFSQNFLGGKLTGFDANGDVYTFRYAETLAANVPYIIKSTTGNNTISTTGIKIPTTESGKSTRAVEEFAGKFYGTMSRIPAADVTSNATTTYYGFVGGELKKLEGASIPAMRAYFTAPVATKKTAPAIRLVDALDNEIEYIEGQPMETGIADIQNVENDKVIYNLNGQRVDNISTSGVYTVNGKKVIVK